MSSYHQNANVDSADRLTCSESSSLLAEKSLWSSNGELNSDVDAVIAAVLHGSTWYDLFLLAPPPSPSRDGGEEEELVSTSCPPQQQQTREPFSTALLSYRYRRLCLALHPDRVARVMNKNLDGAVVEDGTSIEKRARVEAAFQRVREAYDTLSDDAARAAYDARMSGDAAATHLAAAAAAAAERQLAQVSAALWFLFGSQSSSSLLSSSPPSSVAAQRTQDREPFIPSSLKMSALPSRLSRCSALGCLRELTDDDRESAAAASSAVGGVGSVLCKVCRNKPKKCAMFGCMMKATTTSGVDGSLRPSLHCSKHQQQEEQQQKLQR